MSDHLPLFIELRIDFTDKYLKRIPQRHSTGGPADDRRDGRLRDEGAAGLASELVSSRRGREADGAHS
jgi:hypothetical protein